MNLQQSPPATQGSDSLEPTVAALRAPPSGFLGDYIRAWQRQREHVETSGRWHERLVSRFRERIARLADSAEPKIRIEIAREFCSAPHTKVLQRRWGPVRAAEIISQQVQHGASVSLAALASKYFPTLRPTMGRFVVAHILWKEAESGQGAEIRSAIYRRRRLMQANQSNAFLLKDCLIFDSTRRSPRFHLMAREIQRDVRIMLREGVSIRSTCWASKLQAQGRGLASLSTQELSELGRSNASKLQHTQRGIFGLAPARRKELARAAALAPSERKWTAAEENELSRLVSSFRLANGRVNWRQVQANWPGKENKNTLEQRWSLIKRRSRSSP